MIDSDFPSERHSFPGYEAVKQLPVVFTKPPTWDVKPPTDSEITQLKYDEILHKFQVTIEAVVAVYITNIANGESTPEQVLKLLDIMKACSMTSEAMDDVAFIYRSSDGRAEDFLN